MIEFMNVKAALKQEDILKVLAESVYMPTEDRLLEKAEKYMTDQNTVAYGAKVSGIYSGVIVLDRSVPQKLVILNIAVAKIYQKQGIGSKLIEYVKGILHPELIIAETDDDAVEFYRKFGFQIVDLGEKYPGIIRYNCRLDCNYKRSN